MTWISNPLSVGAQSISRSGLGNAESALGCSVGAADIRWWTTLPCLASQKGRWEPSRQRCWEGFPPCKFHLATESNANLYRKALAHFLCHPSHLFAITFTYSGHRKLVQFTRGRKQIKILLMDLFVHKKNSHLPSHMVSWISLFLLLQVLLFLRMSVCAVWQWFSLVIVFFNNKLYNSELPKHLRIN